MTKTPGTETPGSGVLHWAESLEGQDECVKSSEVQKGCLALPEVVVTCESRSEDAERLPCRSSTDEESLCSDSGLSSSPASSLVLRKLSNSSSAGLSPTSSIEEYEEECEGNPGNLTVPRNGSVCPEHHDSVSFRITVTLLSSVVYTCSVMR